jgi:hypothetical protein
MDDFIYDPDYDDDDDGDCNMDSESQLSVPQMADALPTINEQTKTTRQ